MEDVIQAHLGEIAAMDFFVVEVRSLVGLVRYSILFVIDLKTRRVQIAGFVRQAHGEWMKQVARNLTDSIDGFMRGMRYLMGHSLRRSLGRLLGWRQAFLVPTSLPYGAARIDWRPPPQ